MILKYFVDLYFALVQWDSLVIAECHVQINRDSILPKLKKNR